MAEEVKSHARSTRVVTARSRCSLRMGKTTPSDLVAARILKDFNPIDRSGRRERVDKPQGRKGKMVEENH